LPTVRSNVHCRQRTQHLTKIIHYFSSYRVTSKPTITKWC
jgi:hypothetical protein